MSKLSWDEKAKLAWMELTVEDFVQSRATPQDVPFVLDKLQENYSDGKIFMSLHNTSPEASVALLKSASPEILERIHTLLDGQIKRNILEIPLATGSLPEAGELLSKRIRELGI